jgi:hypothetical protein
MEVLATLTQETLPMSTDTTVSPLRRRMIEDMAARKLGPHAQRSHIHSCRRFAAFLGRSPDTATADDVRRFQLHLIESGLSIPNRNRVMTGVRFLFRVTLRRHDLAAEVYHLKEPQKLTAISCPGASRTPPVGARGGVPHAGVRETCTGLDPARGAQDTSNALYPACCRQTFAIVFLSCFHAKAVIDQIFFPSCRPAHKPSPVMQAS